LAETAELFALIPLKAGFRQLPEPNEIIPRLTEIVTANNSIGTYFMQTAIKWEEVAVTCGASSGFFIVP